MGWLTSCDEEALASGANVAILGGELLQFADALPLGGGRFRLSRLIRGLGGTEATSHARGETFVLIQANALRAIPLSAWSKTKTAIVRVKMPSGDVAEASTIVAEPRPGPAHAAQQAIDGDQVVAASEPAIPSPTGGQIVDSEARAAIDSLLAAMRRHGLIQS